MPVPGGGAEVGDVELDDVARGVVVVKTDPPINLLARPQPPPPPPPPLPPLAATNVAFDLRPYVKVTEAAAAAGRVAKQASRPRIV